MEMKRLLLGTFLAVSSFGVMALDCEKAQKEAYEIIKARQQNASLSDLIKKYEPMGKVYVKIVLSAYEDDIQDFYGLDDIEKNYYKRFYETVYRLCLTEKFK